MARTPMMAGNWKMNTNRAGAAALAAAIKERSDSVSAVEKVVCPPFVYLLDVRGALEGSSIRLGAQNVHWEEKGAFTGEVSVTQISEIAEYVIIGHSERRQFFGETDETVNEKTRAAIAGGLQAIVCVGETLAERDAGKAAEVVRRQIRQGLAQLTESDLSPMIVAYEPVWAIGTGRTATPETAAEMHGEIRRTIGEIFGAKAAAALRILYGGSVKPDNIQELMRREDIDGALVGGASLDPASFAAIVKYL